MSDERPEEALALPTERAKETLGAMLEPVSQLDILTLSKVMIQSGFFPDVKTMAQAVVKIVAGKELGFGPVASLRHIYVHRGHIGLMAQLIASAIRNSGRYDYKILACDDEKCEIEFFRLVREQAWDSLGTAAFTIQEATRAGLVKEDSAWKTYPSDVLFARAMTRGQRRFCPDVFRQTVYSKDEIEELMRRDPNGGENPALPPALDLMPKKIGETPPAAPPAEPVDPGVAGDPGGSPDSEISEQERWEAFLGVAEPDRKVVPVEPEPIRPVPVPPVPAPTAVGSVGPPPASAAAPPLAPGLIRFTLNNREMVTAGVTKDQFLKIVKLSAQADQLCGKGTAKEILGRECGCEHRTELREADAVVYLVALTKRVNQALAERGRA